MSDGPDDVDAPGDSTATDDGRPAEEPPDPDDSWQFSVDDVPVTGDGDADDRDGNVAGSLVSDRPLEPGEIDPEHAFFVALGVVIVLGLIGGAMLGL